MTLSLFCFSITLICLSVSVKTLLPKLEKATGKRAHSDLVEDPGDRNRKRSIVLKGPSVSKKRRTFKGLPLLPVLSGEDIALADRLWNAKTPQTVKCKQRAMMAGPCYVVASDKKLSKERPYQEDLENQDESKKEGLTIESSDIMKLKNDKLIGDPVSQYLSRQFNKRELQKKRENPVSVWARIIQWNHWSGRRTW